MLELKIGDILEKVKRKKKIKASDYKIDGRFPIIDQSENFIAGYTDDEDAIIDECLPIIVFGDHTRRLKFIDFPFACGADGTQLIYPNREDIDVYFLYSALKVVDLSDFAYARHFKFLKDQVVPFPSPESQKEISCFLKRYDDLINNNQRRIGILEDMAQSLYREWFVHFRFPGHEKTKMTDSPLGPIPQGWGVVPIHTFGEVITGKTPSTSKPEYFGDQLPFVKIPDMHGNPIILKTTQNLSNEGKNSQSTKTLPAGSIIVSCIATIGLVSINAEICQTNQQINSVVLNKETDRYYLYFVCKSLEGHLKAIGSNGATMGNVNKEKFSNVAILNPEKSALEKFHAMCTPLFSMIENLMRQNNSLTETRDLILPKLISGEIDLSAATSKTEEAA